MKVKFNFGGSNQNKRNELKNFKDEKRIKNTKLISDKKINNNKEKRTESPNKALDEIRELVGLNKVKKFLKELEAYVYVQKIRKKEGLISDSMVLHMIFKGNPGTGKTTVARILGKFFKEVGILSKGHMVEVERADLVGEYIGHTAQKTREHIKKAVGGILFIDEAYSLARGGEKDFGREAIDCLVKGMEDYKDSFIVILAGYKNEMEYFIRTNPGLESRFPIQLEFPDYSLEELVEIAKLMLSKKQYRMTMEAEIKLEKILRKFIFSGYNSSGNARLVRNIVESSIRRQAYRLVSNGVELNKETLQDITAEDIETNEITEIIENENFNFKVLDQDIVKKST